MLSLLAVDVAYLSHSQDVEPLGDETDGQSLQPWSSSGDVYSGDS